MYSMNQQCMVSLYVEIVHLVSDKITRLVFVTGRFIVRYSDEKVHLPLRLFSERLSVVSAVRSPIWLGIGPDKIVDNGSTVST